MHPSKSTAPADKNAGGGGGIAVDVDLPPFIRRYEDGRVERLLRSNFVPASADPGIHGVATRDVAIDLVTGVSARLFLPSGAGAGRLPLVVYIHGGAFCTESAFGRTYHRYAASLAARAGAVVVSVEYRLAPEHPVPAAYEDAWTALQWAACLSDPWLADHADPMRTFIAGDSAGGNIAYHTALRAGFHGGGSGVAGVDIEGLIMVQPYFWGASRLPCETAVRDGAGGATLLPPEMVDGVWPFLTAGRAGNDDPRIDPPEQEIASLTCRRALIAVAGKDTLRGRGLQLAAGMRGSGWWAEDDVKVVESEGEDHGFHLYSPLRATSKELMESIVQFINQTELQEPSPREMMDSAQALISLPTRPYSAVMAWTGPRSMELAPGRGKDSKTRCRSYLGQMKPMKALKIPLPTAAPWRAVMKSCF